MTNAPRIQAARAPARNGTSLRAKRRGRIPSERLKDRGEPEEQPASNTNDEREAEDARVHGEVNSLRNHEGVEQRRADASDEQRPDRAQDPKKHGFGEPLTDEPCAAGADRDPHGDLPLARHRAREQQARDIHAGDQEHHQHGTRKLPQHRSRRDAEASALAERRKR